MNCTTRSTGTGLIDRRLRGANVHVTFQSLGAGMHRAIYISVQRSENAILITTPMISTPDTITTDARNSMQYALNFEPLHIHQAGGQISFGNQCGLGTPKQFGDLQQKIIKIPAKVSSHNQSISVTNRD